MRSLCTREVEGLIPASECVLLLLASAQSSLSDVARSSDSKKTRADEEFWVCDITPKVTVHGLCRSKTNLLDNLHTIPNLAPTQWTLLELRHASVTRAQG